MYKNTLDIMIKQCQEGKNYIHTYFQVCTSQYWFLHLFFLKINTSFGCKLHLQIQLMNICQCWLTKLNMQLEIHTIFNLKGKYPNSVSLLCLKTSKNM